MSLDIQNLNQANFTGDFGKLIGGHDLNHQIVHGVMMIANNLFEFLKDPNVQAVLISSAVTYATVFWMVASAGFNLPGIAADSLAAAVQSMYGGLVPAGSLFATLQSMGMLGRLLPVQFGIAGVSAALIAAIVWALVIGRE